MSDTPRTNAFAKNPNPAGQLASAPEAATGRASEKASGAGRAGTPNAPEGWMLVPKVPTEDMLRDGLRAYQDAFGTPLTRVAAEWSAMLFIAPHPETPPRVWLRDSPRNARMGPREPERSAHGRTERKMSEHPFYEAGYAAGYAAGLRETKRDHLRYEYLRRLNVPQFRAIFERAIKGEQFDDVIDACLAGCTPGCRNDNHPGCAICMSPR